MPRRARTSIFHIFAKSRCNSAALISIDNPSDMKIISFPLRHLQQTILFAFLLFIALTGPVSAQGPADLHVEPPFWWAGMKNPSLQLLVYGKDIAFTNVSLNYPGVTLRDKVSVENPNYLFLNLEIAADAKPGVFVISFMRNRKVAYQYAYELRQRKEGSAGRKGFTPADVIYLLMPDRFANGDPTNDNMPGMLETADRSNPSGRHGGDISGIRKNLDYLSELGVTALWINPLLENNNPAYSYHGYAITDFYRIDPRLGTNEDYVNLVEAAHHKGIKVIKDMIFNHCGINHWFINDLPMSNWIHRFPEFTRSNFRAEALSDPYASDYDKNRLLQGWFDTNMPDLDQRNPYVNNYLIQNSIWWIEYAGLDGIRLDTQPYPYKEMIAEWGRRVFEEYPDFSIVGEAWLNQEGMLAYYQKDAIISDGYNSNLPSVTDFPLYEATKKAFTENEGWTEGMARLYYVFAQDFLFSDPYMKVTFLDNHDVNRYFNTINRDLPAMKMALTFLLTTRGIPQIYYGTELLMDGAEHKGHGDIRWDFPGGWKGDTTNAFVRKGRSKDQNEVFDHMKQLLRWRKSSNAIARGSLRHFIPFDGVYVYFRMYGDETVMVVINNSYDEKTIDTGRFTEVFAGYNHALDVLTGRSVPLHGKLTSKGRTAMVFELKK